MRLVLRIGLYRFRHTRVNSADFPSMFPDNPDEPVVIPITDVLDLHSVPPRDVEGVIFAWLEEVKSRGLQALRIIHGRGIGVQRERVRAILSRDPDVLSFHDAPLEAGGWGATVITLRKSPGNQP